MSSSKMDFFLEFFGALRKFSASMTAAISSPSSVFSRGFSLTAALFSTAM